MHPVKAIWRRAPRKGLLLSGWKKIILGRNKSLPEENHPATRSNLLKIVGLAVKYLLISLAIVYAIDWTVFEVRQGRGTGMKNVLVEQYLATTLKGNKAEYDYTGTAEVKCSRTLFPQYAASIWNRPCWWLEHHKKRWE